MVQLDGAVQRRHHHVHHFRVTHPVAETGAFRDIARAAHGFHAAAHRGIAKPQLYLLGSGDDGLQPATAEPVDGNRGGFMGQAAAQCRHPRDVHVLGLGVYHVADGAVADGFRCDTGPGYGFPHHVGGEVPRALVLEAAAVVADSGAYAAGQINIVDLHG